MPSCDGSNCSASTRTVVEYRDNPMDKAEITRLRKMVEDLKRELREKESMEDVVKKLIKQELENSK